MNMQKEPTFTDRHYYSTQYFKKPRGPRFGLLLLIIIAIFSIIIALTVAYLFT